jgi:hypothetical protein
MLPEIRTEASDVGNRRVFQRLVNGRIAGSVRVKSEHVSGESILVTALTMLKAAKKGIPAPGSEVRATFIKSANCRALRHTKPAAMEPSDAQKAEAPEWHQELQ